jgi:hypothetical protein
MPSRYAGVALLASNPSLERKEKSSATRSRAQCSIPADRMWKYGLMPAPFSALKMYMKKKSEIRVTPSSECVYLLEMK